MTEQGEGGQSKNPTELTRGMPSLSPADFALLFLTCFAAPLVAHLCDLIVGPDNNPLSGEKLLCTYFVLIALYVIYENIINLLKKTQLWDKGWKLGNSDAMLFALYVVGATIVVRYYDTLPGTLIIVGVFALLFVLLIFKPSSVHINSRKMILFAFVAAVILPAALIRVYGGESYSNPGFLVALVVGQFFVCVMFDAIYVLLKKVNMRYAKKMSNGE